MKSRASLLKQPDMGHEDSDDGDEQPRHVLSPELCAQMLEDDPITARIVIDYTQHRVSVAQRLTAEFERSRYEIYTRLSQTECSLLSLLCMGMAKESPALLERMVECVPGPLSAEEYQMIERFKALIDEKKTGMKNLLPLLHELLRMPPPEEAAEDRDA
jgi:hypothetical protein